MHTPTASHTAKKMIGIFACLALFMGLYDSAAESKARSGGKGKNQSQSQSQSGSHDRANKLKSKKYIEATHTFAAGGYHKAFKEFQELDKNGMCCDMVHYYMAMCCQRMNQMGPAVQNYRYVVAYSKDPTLRYYADTASRQLGYYQKHRTYAGQGNVFVGMSKGPGGGPGRGRGGGGG